MLLTTAVQITFYIETRGEIPWAAAAKVATSWDGIKLLWSGSLETALCAAAIATVSFVLKFPLYHGVGRLLQWFWRTVWAPNTSVSGADDLHADLEKLRSSAEMPSAVNSSWFTRTVLLTPLAVVTVLQVFRPHHSPYPEMSSILPITLLSAFGSLGAPPREYCYSGLVESMKPFPLPKQLSPHSWTPAAGHSPAWHPNADWSNPDTNLTAHIDRPNWLPLDGALPGFGRWGASDRPYANNYLPELDPLKLSNMNADLLAAIKTSLNSSGPKIKHIVLLTLESTRADVFPLTNHSHLYNSVVDSHIAHGAPNTSAFDSSSINVLLADISPVAELLTGQSNSSGFQSFRVNSTDYKPGSWRARLAARPSSINILGATTGSSMTMKSMLGSHCGLHPLPVEFTEEGRLTPYQPCLAHILDLFNRNKPPASGVNGSLNAPWRSVFVQATTDMFDNQNLLNQKMGFAPCNTFVRANLTDSRSKYGRPTEPESNYFSFPETQTKPYLRDLLKQVHDSGERLFLSHLTSQTHHPFNTPEAFGEHEDYLRKGSWGKEALLNRYLNTIRYGDRWLGEIMDLLDEAGMTDETLLVVVGDQ